MGPVCIFIFQIASLKGVFSAVIGVLGVLIIDCLYILAAILGISSFIKRKNIKLFIKIFGAIILFVFGISTIFGAFNIDFLPIFKNSANINNVFLHTMILTASNPLTIIFWAGVFSTKIAEENLRQHDLYLFGFGAILSTLFFLTLVAVIGSLFKTFLPFSIILTLNVLVGLLLIYFSIKMIFNCQS